MQGRAYIYILRPPLMCVSWSSCIEIWLAERFKPSMQLGLAMRSSSSQLCLDHPQHFYKLITSNHWAARHFPLWSHFSWTPQISRVQHYPRIPLLLSVKIKWNKYIKTSNKYLLEFVNNASSTQSFLVFQES